ncbi:MAG: Zn-binding domain-containing protein, partial [Candidatus Kariarchaeaceae archaeon]
QRIGRAGRKGQESFATLVLRGDDPISAYFARNPEEYLSELNPAFVEPDNPVIARYQLLAMLLDKPMNITESIHYDYYINELVDQKLVKQYKNQIVLTDRMKVQSILQQFSIRGIGKSVSIWKDNKSIGERALPMALSELHEGAIYLHGGQSYKVRKYNEKLRMASLSYSPIKNEKTQALRTIRPKMLGIKTEKEIHGLTAVYCQLELTEIVHGYFRQNIFNNKIIGKYQLSNPISYAYKTMGFLLSLPKPEHLVDGLNPLEVQKVLGGTFHAIEHVLIESGNSLTGGGANQIGGIALGDTGLVVVYDGTEGGSGLSRMLYGSLHTGLMRSLKIMEDCPCKRDDGCPRCTYSYYCGNNNQPLHRIGAIEALRKVGKETTTINYDFEGIETYVISPINY